MDFHKKHRHEPTEPQLATMIDVFSILIIFLIAGTAMDASTIVIPGGIKMPSVRSHGGPLSAAQVTIKGSQVVFSITNKEYPLAWFADPGRYSAELAEIKNATKAFQEKAKTADRKFSSGSTDFLNFVADARDPYRSIFSVIKYFRSVGFKSIVMVGLASRGKS